MRPKLITLSMLFIAVFALVNTAQQQIPVSFNTAAADSAAVYFTPVDVGNFNDGGGDGGGGGGDYYDSDGSGSGGGIFFLVLIGGIVIFGIWVTIHQRRKHKNILHQIQEKDASFSQDAFKAWTKQVFTQYHYAKTERNALWARPFTSDELFEKLQAKVQRDIRLGKRDITEFVQLTPQLFTAYEEKDGYQYLTMNIHTKIHEYTLDDRTQNVIQGAPQQDISRTYVLKFMRRIGVTTNPSLSNKSTSNCPNCGTPVHITPEGQCAYCTYVVTTGDFDWVLCELNSFTGSTASGVPNETEKIQQLISTNDPHFSSIQFMEWGKDVFVKLQAAWTARDWNQVRAFENDTMFKTHQTQLEEYIRMNRINIVENIRVNETFLTAYTADTQYEYLTMYLQADMNDYVIDASTRAVVKNDPNHRFQTKYTLKFMRRKGVLTNPATSNRSTTNCPNCGAATHVTSTGKCDYCSSVITTGDFDWVLCELGVIR